ncbi:hypothetical protein COO60DRAFT_1701517 [Scenedesmus sp. NREL 46B-D3]|nr:hypothetical protein COO60DRAFT_1701517 [Scenedesmus sp. NREL 46B-D3]
MIRLALAATAGQHHGTAALSSSLAWATCQPLAPNSEHPPQAYWLHCTPTYHGGSAAAHLVTWSSHFCRDDSGSSGVAQELTRCSATWSLLLLCQHHACWF